MAYELLGRDVKIQAFFSFYMARGLDPLYFGL